MGLATFLVRARSRLKGFPGLFGFRAAIAKQSGLVAQVVAIVFVVDFAADAGAVVVVVVLVFHPRV